MRRLEPVELPERAASRRTQRSQRIPLTCIVSDLTPSQSIVRESDEALAAGREAPSLRPISSCAPAWSRPSSTPRRPPSPEPTRRRLDAARGAPRGARADEHERSSSGWTSPAAARSGRPPSGSGRRRPRSAAAAPGSAARQRAPGRARRSAAVSASRVGWSGTRISSVPRRGWGRTSHQRRMRSSASPSSTRARRSGPSPRSPRTQAARPPGAGAASSSARVEARPVSAPAAYGELAETARRTGSHGRTASSRPMHSSGLATPTWTWRPAQCWRRAEDPAYFAKRSRGSFGVTCCLLGAPPSARCPTAASSSP